jgi:DNA-binding transcriptional regulator LsrR (DeoR family)
MARIDDLRLMARVASLYYERGLSQVEIAERLQLSQSNVSRLLKRAQQEQIVRITVSMPRGVYTDLEDQLETLYGLKEAVVADCPEDASAEQMLQAIGGAAAFWLESRLKPGEIVGISSWSASLLAMVDAMHPLAQPSRAQVVQILGGIGNPAAEVHATQLTRRLAELVHGEAVFLPAPGVVSSPEARRVFFDDPFVCEAVGLFERVTLALVGIGAVEPSALLASSGNIFALEELHMLREHGAVGDIVLRFFDGQGRPVVTPLDERVIGMRLDQLQRVKYAVGVAGGARKLAAIRGALAGRWINVLITDHITARALVQQPEGSSSS